MPAVKNCMIQVQKQQMIQQQRLLMTQDIKMILKLIAMPAVELREFIIEEAEKNPAIEIIKDPLFDKKIKLRNRASLRLSSNISSEAQLASDDFQNFLESIEETRTGSLQSYLLEQAGFVKTDEETSGLIRLVIQNLDEKGFNSVPPEELIKSGSGQPSEVLKRKLEKAVSIVQKLDPPGCAVNNFKESLIVQARYIYSEVKDGFFQEREKKLCLQAITVLEKYFDYLKNGKASEIIRAFKAGGTEISEYEAEEILNFIKKLTPFPGSRFSGERVEKEYIIPDIYVKKTEEGFSAVINSEEIPVLKISSAFKKTADKDGFATEKEKKFALGAVKSADKFLKLLTQREQTILKVVKAIIVYQQEFFKFGITKLCPLRLQDIADEVGFSISTISRVTKGKYLDCEWGIFELNYFFTAKVISGKAGYEENPYGNYSEGGISKENIKAVIKEIIENSETKLSDQKISELLKEKNIPISRRTVNKYRTEMQIASSYDREK